jgi:hypothetical protein
MAGSIAGSPERPLEFSPAVFFFTLWLRYSPD